MSDRGKDVAGYLLPNEQGPVLNDELLARVYELNRDYVELLLDESSDPAPDAGFETLPGKVLEGLARLSPESRRALTASSFALYALNFGDLAFWASVLSNPPPRLPGPAGAGLSIAMQYGSSTDSCMRAAFCEVALFFAWHVVASSRVAARLLFAIPDALSAQLARAPLWQLKRIAMDHPRILTPRWPRNPCFWPDLIHFAAVGDAVRLATAQLLGNQLIALELESALAQGRKYPSPLRFR